MRRKGKVCDAMPLYKCWIYIDSLDIDVAHIYPANSIQEALQIAKAYASSLNGKLKVVDNIHSGMSASPLKNPRKR
jgi:hypothetical protein